MHPQVLRVLCLGTCLAGGAALAAGGAAAAPQPAPGSATAAGSVADLVLHGGRVLTLQQPEPQPAPTAIAIGGGRVLLVGSDAEALALAGPGARRIDLAGAVVVPGLCDAHGHVAGLGKALEQVDLVGTRSAEECAARVREAARTLPPDAWVQGRGWDQNDWAVQEFPTRALLDEAGGGRPVLLSRVDGHAAWVSGEALRRAGIDASAPDPDGGRVIRDPAGAPTGVLIDRAIELVTAQVPPATPADLRRQLRLAFAHLVSRGLTSAQDAGVTLPVLRAYEELDAAGELPLRIDVMLEGDDEEVLAAALPGGPRRPAGGRLQVGMVKLYADGALGSRGALLLGDYSDEPGRRGLAVSPRERLVALARRAGEAGFQVCTHAIGDGGNRLVLDVYEQVLGELNLTDARWRVEHAQVLHPFDLPRFARLGVIASMQPVHCTSDMDWVGSRLGPDRAGGAYAWRSLLDSGARLCFGTDFPVERVEPLEGLYAARTRQHPDGTPAGGWHPEQRLDGLTALRLYTEAGAYAAFREDELGRLAPGMLADLTVLTVDPVACAPRDLLGAQVLGTIVGGEVVYAGEAKD